MAVQEPPATPDDQKAVVAFLSRPETYRLSGEPVDVVTTHCSIVFLVGDRAYKLKRSIRYASLDYTTADLRHTACVREVALNRRTAPDLYLGVQSINRDQHGRLALDGPGPAVETVVVLRRFPEADLFERMLAGGRLTPHLMRLLGATIGRFHAGALKTPAFGGSAALQRVIADNDRELAKVAGELDGAAVHLLSSRCHDALAGVSGLLDNRRASGKVRQAHGDLRLANICLYDGRPTLFDCIEFSDEIGCIDLLYDLAFLLMDLLLHGRGDFANIVFNSYLDLMTETGGLRALPLFLALRAVTRSYALAGAAKRRTDAEEAARLGHAAREHVEAALRFLQPERPVLVLIDGDTAGGNAALAASIASETRPAPGARILRFAAPATEPIDMAGAILSAGCSVVLDGPCAKDAIEAAANTISSQQGIRVRAIWHGSTPPSPRGVLKWEPALRCH